MAETTQYSYQDLALALRRVIAQPALADKLKANETSAEATRELGIDGDLRREIVNVLNELDKYRPRDAARTTAPAPDQGEADDARNFLRESFGQMRRAYLISLLMSFTIFVTGMGFLMLAAIRSVGDPGNIAVTSVVAEVGVVQIVALFYQNPLLHVGRAMADAQQARIAVMSYLLGLSLLQEEISMGRPEERHFQYLLDLTEKTLGHIRELTRERSESLRSARRPNARADRPRETRS